MWYFSYGANMTRQILVGRRGVKPISSELARLKGYHLVFTQPGLPFIEPAFASIAPREKHDVFGVLHNILPEDLITIDNFEGPEYERVEFDVHGIKSGKVTAWTYRSRNPCAGLEPSIRYLNLILDGAREFGLPEAYIAELLKTNTCAEIPIVTPLLPVLFGLAERIASKYIIAQKIGYGLLKLLAKTHR